jgi:hypothetical protein
MLTNINSYAARGCLYSSGYLYINENAILWGGLPRFDWNSATLSGRVLGSDYCVTSIGTTGNSCVIVNEFLSNVQGTLVDYRPLPCPIDNYTCFFFAITTLGFIAVRVKTLQ